MLAQRAYGFISAVFSNLAQEELGGQGPQEPKLGSECLEEC